MIYLLYMFFISNNHCIFTSTNKQKDMKNLIEKSAIQAVAQIKGLNTKTVIKKIGFDVEKMCDIDEEFFVVDLGNFKYAFFLLCQETFDLSYSHNYNGNTGKTTKRIPKIFK